MGEQAHLKGRGRRFANVLRRIARKHMKRALLQPSQRMHPRSESQGKNEEDESERESQCQRGGIGGGSKNLDDASLSIPSLSPPLFFTSFPECAIAGSACDGACWQWKPRTASTPVLNSPTARSTVRCCSQELVSLTLYLEDAPDGTMSSSFFSSHSLLGGGGGSKRGSMLREKLGEGDSSTGSIALLLCDDIRFL